MARFCRLAVPTLFIALLLPDAAHADVKLPAIFSDHMVLQQDKPIVIWGWANAGEEVTVALGDSSAKVTADASGKWSAHLPNVKASAKPQTLAVKGANALTVNDVLV